jgi:hypothetical protein
MHLFFVRAFNDIDHTTPVVYKMHLDGNPVVVYCLDPDYDIRADYRLRFLAGLGVPVDYVQGAPFDLRSVRHHILGLLMVRCFAAARSLSKASRPATGRALPRLGRRFRRMARKLFRHLTRVYYDEAWARNLIEKHRAVSLCFDWVRPKDFVVDVLLAAASASSVPAFSLPHGVFIYANDDIYAEPFDEDHVYEKYSHYDYVIVQNKLFKDYMTRHGVDASKIFVLGSARYCDEWMRQNAELVPRLLASSETNGDRLKVVFMTTWVIYKIDVEQLFRTTRALGALNQEDIEVVIKPHTRFGTEGQLYEDSGLPIIDDVSSVELCEWADVVLVIASSIMIEALVREKPVLYLKYLHGNTTLYEQYGACWSVGDIEELKNALRTLKQDSYRIPYGRDNVDRFVTDVIGGGVEGRDVLEDYEHFIVERTTSPSAPS